MARDPRANELRRSPVQCPEGREAVKENQQKEKTRADNVTRRDGDLLAVHLDRPLPLLEIEPWANKKPNHDGHGISPVVPIVGRQLGEGNRPYSL